MSGGQALRQAHRRRKIGCGPSLDGKGAQAMVAKLSGPETQRLSALLGPEAGGALVRSINGMIEEGGDPSESARAEFRLALALIRPASSAGIRPTSPAGVRAALEPGSAGTFRATLMGWTDTTGYFEVEREETGERWSGGLERLPRTGV